MCAAAAGSPAPGGGHCLSCRRPGCGAGVPAGCRQGTVLCARAWAAHHGWVTQLPVTVTVVTSHGPTRTAPPSRVTGAVPGPGVHTIRGGRGGRGPGPGNQAQAKAAPGHRDRSKVARAATGPGPGLSLRLPVAATQCRRGRRSPPASCHSELEAAAVSRARPTMFAGESPPNPRL